MRHLKGLAPQRRAEASNHASPQHQASLCKGSQATQRLTKATALQRLKHFTGWHVPDVMIMKSSRLTLPFSWLGLFHRVPTSPS
jgi:hypothetical protein